MNVIDGNITDVQYGIIGHQTNCQMVMGAGVAKALRDKWPRVFTEYRDIMGRVEPRLRLGSCQMVEITRYQLYVANLFGQFHFRPRGIRHTDYNALTSALHNVNKWRNQMAGPEFPIYLPYGIGCGLAGGDWNIVKNLIEQTVQNVTLVKFN